jgi:hypothetical protein
MGKNEGLIIHSPIEVENLRGKHAKALYSISKIKNVVCKNSRHVYELTFTKLMYTFVHKFV